MKKAGLCIDKNHNYLGSSSDGIIYKNGKKLYAIEIKCSYSGRLL